MRPSPRWRSRQPPAMLLLLARAGSAGRGPASAAGAAAAAARARAFSAAPSGRQTATTVDMGDGVVDQVRGCRLLLDRSLFATAPTAQLLVDRSPRPATKPMLMTSNTTHHGPQIGAKHRQVIGPRTLVVCSRLGGPEEPHVQRVLARLRGVRGGRAACLQQLPRRTRSSHINPSGLPADYQCIHAYMYTLGAGGHPVRDLLDAGALPDHAGQSITRPSTDIDDRYHTMPYHTLATTHQLSFNGTDTYPPHA